MGFMQKCSSLSLSLDVHTASGVSGPASRALGQSWCQIQHEGLADAGLTLTQKHSSSLAFMILRIFPIPH